MSRDIDESRREDTYGNLLKEAGYGSDSDGKSEKVEKTVIVKEEKTVDETKDKSNKMVDVKSKLLGDDEKIVIDEAP